MNGMQLKDKVAIITGASRGIGRAIALAFANEGAYVTLCATNLEALSEVHSSIEASRPGSSILMQTNVSNGDEVAQAVKKTLDSRGRVDILVNNAGTTRDNLLALMTEEEWDQVLSTNLKSVFLMTKACTRPMIKQRSGVIINMASVVGITGNAGQANYAASKAGVIAFTKSAARELARRSIRVNAIAPGFIKTRMTGQLSPEIQQKLIEQIPLGRYGEAEEVAEAAVFLASEKARYITGQVIVVDGGLVT